MTSTHHLPENNFISSNVSVARQDSVLKSISITLHIKSILLQNLLPTRAFNYCNLQSTSIRNNCIKNIKNRQRLSIEIKFYVLRPQKPRSSVNQHQGAQYNYIKKVQEGWFGRKKRLSGSRKYLCCFPFSTSATDIRD